jgi:hypothetical protein
MASQQARRTRGIRTDQAEEALREIRRRLVSIYYELAEGPQGIAGSSDAPASA